MHDYGFLGRDDERCMPMLVSKSSETSWIDAASVPAKGDVGTYSIEVISDHIKHMGHSKLLHKSDQEASLKKLMEAGVVALKGAVTAIPESSPVGSKGSKGSMENGVKQIEGLARTHRDAVEQSQKIKVEHKSPIVPWLVLWTSYVYNRLSVDANGRTPYEKTKGKPFRKELVPFGERVFWLPLTRAQKQGRSLNKLEDKWRIGHFLGVKEGTDESYIGLEDGQVIRTRAIRRMMATARVSPDTLLAVKGVPWSPNPAKVSKREVPIDVDVQIGRSGIEEKELPKVPEFEPKESGVRRTYIRRNELEEYGYTLGCAACVSIEATGATMIAHGEICRAGIEKAMFEAEDGRRKLEATAARLEGKRAGGYHHTCNEKHNRCRNRK